MTGNAAIALVATCFALGLTARLAAARLCAPAKPPPAWCMAAVAAIMGISALATAPRLGPSAAGAILGWGLLTLAAVDLADLRLPDSLTMPLIGLGLVIAAFSLGGPTPTPALSPPALIDHLIGVAVGYGAFAGLAAAYRRLRGRDGLGLGDAKLAACAGAWLGWRALPWVVLLACAITFIWIAVKLALKKSRGEDEPIPFGAPLALAVWIVWLVPVDIWNGLGD